VDVFFEKNKNPLSLSYSHDYENETQIWRFYCLLYILVSAYSYGVGVLEQKKTLLCVITCFLTGVYPVAFSYLFFSVPAIFVGAPPSLAGLFSIFTSAALELLYGGTWTGTDNTFSIGWVNMLNILETSNAMVSLFMLYCLCFVGRL